MPLTVLVLDDDHAFRSKFAARELKEMGYHVLEAGKIAEARELLARARPDLMIADGLLPDGNGVEFIAQIRRQGVALPVIFVSAFWKDRETFERLTALGNVQVMRKPVRVGDLGKRVESMLGPVSVDVDLDFE